MEAPADLMAGFILCHLKGVNEAFLVSACEPNRGAIGEYGEDARMEHLPPVSKVQAPDGVAQNGQHRQGGLCSGGHDRDVHAP